MKLADELQQNSSNRLFISSTYIYTTHSASINVRVSVRMYTVCERVYVL